MMFYHPFRNNLHPTPEKPHLNVDSHTLEIRVSLLTGSRLYTLVGFLVTENTEWGWETGLLLQSS